MGKTALVLAGGGSRGSYELGVWQALREMGVQFEIVTGTSIGAINGSLIAQGDYDTAVALWDTIQTSHIFEVAMNEQEPVKEKVAQAYRTFVKNFIADGGTATNPLKETLEGFFDEEKIRSSRIEYGLVTIEMDSGRPCEFFLEDIPQGRIIDFILASASIYPAFKPYVIDGVRYVDGAYHDNLPVEMALRKGATSIIAVDLEAFGVVKKESLKLAREVKYIRCAWDLGPTLVFDHDTIRRNIRLGYLDGMKAYGAYEGHAYSFICGSSSLMAMDKDGTVELERLFEPKATQDSASKTALSRLRKFLREYGLQKTNSPDIALTCAEIAGRTFGLSPETIYPLPVWDASLREAVEAVELPEDTVSPPDAKKKTGVLRALRESTALLDKRVRTIYAAKLIYEASVTGEYGLLLTGGGLLPDAFLGGLYLALRGLIS